MSAYPWMDGCDECRKWIPNLTAGDYPVEGLGMFRAALLASDGGHRALHREQVKHERAQAGYAAPRWWQLPRRWRARHDRIVAGREARRGGDPGGLR